MKELIDQLYSYLNTNIKAYDYDELWDLLGSLYAVGTEWEKFQYFFEKGEQNEKEKNKTKN